MQHSARILRGRARPSGEAKRSCNRGMNVRASEKADAFRQRRNPRRAPRMNATTEPAVESLRRIALDGDRPAKGDCAGAKCDAGARVHAPRERKRCT